MNFCLPFVMMLISRFSQNDKFLFKKKFLIVQAPTAIISKLEVSNLCPDYKIVQHTL